LVELELEIMGTEISPRRKVLDEVVAPAADPTAVFTVLI
jgi:hypothetical protein